MVTVLVVDDSPIDRMVAGGLLEKTGLVTLRFAEDGLDALDQMARDLPALIVTDIVMPNLDGFGLVAEVVQRFPQVPVVLMTGHGSEEIAVRALREGASSYVPKGSLSTMLADTVTRLIELSESNRTQTRLLGQMVANHCTFILENDLAMIPPLINYLSSCLRNLGGSDDGTSLRICVALEEALNNAIYHGNLELGSELREDQALYRRMIEERRNTLPYSKRGVFVEGRFSRKEAVITIRDEGPGFDPGTLPDPTDPMNLDRPCGRGVMLMRTFMDDLKFNATGNEVTLIKRFETSTSDNQ